MLEVSALRVASGAMTRVQSLDLSLAAGGCVALLGPNGAGKTASVEAIAGLVPKAAGRVMFNGEDITGFTASTVVRRGLALVPQWRELFPNFSVEETLLAGSNAARGRPAASLRSGLRSLSEACGTAASARRLAVRRRAADAGDRARARHQSESDAARRTVGGPCGRNRARVRRGGKTHPRHRGRDPAGRAEPGDRGFARRVPASCSPRDAWYGAGPPATPPTARKSGKPILPERVDRLASGIRDVSEIRVGRLLARPGDGPCLYGATIALQDGRVASVEASGDPASAGEGKRFIALPALTNPHDHGRGLRHVAVGATDQRFELWRPALYALPPLDPYLNCRRCVRPAGAGRRGLHRRGLFLDQDRSPAGRCDRHLSRRPRRRRAAVVRRADARPDDARLRAR